MFEFQEEVVFTGLVKRVSKKTEKEYYLLNFLDENGESVSAMVECPVPQLSQLDKIVATFKLQLGRYMQLKIIAIEV